MSDFSSLMLVDCGLAKQWGNPFPHRSLGLLSCRQYLEMHGIVPKLVISEEVEVCIPFRAEPVGSFISEASADCTDFIGFTTTSDSLPVVLYLAERIRQAQTGGKSRIVLGGIGASSYPRQLLECFPFIDAIVVGEGEQTLLELAEAGPDRRRWGKIRGLAYRASRGTIRENPPRQRCPNLERFPLPYSYARYHLDGFKKERQTCSAITSRGCNGHCHFCSHSLMWKGIVTHHPASQIVPLIEEVRKKHPEAHLAFQDDDFLSQPQKLIDLAGRIESQGITVPFSIFGRLDRIDEPTLELLVRSNCASIIFGLDAMTDTGRKHLGKPWTYSDALPRLRLAQGHIQDIEINLIYGWAEESMEDFRTTLKEAYALRMDGFHIKVAPLAVYPGTPIHRKYSRQYDLHPAAELFEPLYGEAFRYVKGHPFLFPNFCANRFDPNYAIKKRMLGPLCDAFTVYDEV